MKVIDPGHVYKLDWFDGLGESVLIFMKREGPGYPGNVGHHAGTNIQEVLRALIDRVIYLDNQIHHENNIQVVHDLRRALWNLEQRAAERHYHHRRNADKSIGRIETYSTCRKCGHVGCTGACH